MTVHERIQALMRDWRSIEQQWPGFLVPLENTIRDAMRDQREACAEAVLAVEWLADYGPDTYLIDRNQARGEVMNAEVK